jgi:hypothetical protein
MSRRFPDSCSRGFDNGATKGMLLTGGNPFLKAC